ncbi:hypothetical protein SC09_contig4orf01270 [Bacillus subtilis]|uniref:Uncharacterized protein n=1 Tax=Bacillus subtilis TaxID=1423 RepID=A0A0D1IBD6_BACIU|nr:hypothetical protein SC09_contig4orf01270 [Bacillus subtilis]
MYGWGIFRDAKGVSCKMESIFEKTVLYTCKKTLMNEGS